MWRYETIPAPSEGIRLATPLPRRRVTFHYYRGQPHGSLLTRQTAARRAEGTTAVPSPRMRDVSCQRLERADGALREAWSRFRRWASLKSLRALIVTAPR